MKSESVGTPRSHAIGYGSIAASWLFAAWINVQMNILNTEGVSAYEILIVRSLPCIGIAFVLGMSFRPQSWTVLASGALIAIASIGFYSAVECWKAVNPVMILITLMPLANIAIARLYKRRVSILTALSALVLIIGVMQALDYRGQAATRSWPGFWWSIVSMASAAVGFEMWGRMPRSVTVLEKITWLSIACFIMALVLLVPHMRELDLAKYGRADIQLRLFGWFMLPALGFIYTSCVPFSDVGKMDVVTASILLQGATPATVVATTFLTHERLTPSQMLGLALALVGAAIVTRQLLRPSKTVALAPTSG
jgi:drug/metabolite transporter (DMT)-like permease